VLVYLEVFKEIKTADLPTEEQLAAVDVTDMSELERCEILADLKVLYGADCKYRKHLCGHLEGVACKVEVL